MKLTIRMLRPRQINLLATFITLSREGVVFFPGTSNGIYPSIWRIVSEAMAGRNHPTIGRGENPGAKHNPGTSSDTKRERSHRKQVEPSRESKSDDEITNYGSPGYWCTAAGL
jgi:hypothetical protein